MLDDHEIASILTKSGTPYGVRQGVVAAINADSTIDVTVGGSSVIVPGVRYSASVCPRVSASVLLLADGRDLFAFDTIAPAGPAYARVRRTTDQNCTSGEATTVSFGNPPGEITDAWAMFSQPSTIVIPMPGLYAIAFHYAFAGNSTGYRMAEIFLNGASVAIDRRTAVTGAPTYGCADAELALAKGDAITAVATQNSGGTLALSGGAVYRNWMSVTYRGPA